MKSSELRQGNLYKDKVNNVLRVVNITRRFGYGENNEVVVTDLINDIHDESEALPIPLTEEWLVGLGFEKQFIKWKNGLGESMTFKYKMNAYNSFFCVYWYTYCATGEDYKGWRSYIDSGNGLEKDHWPYIEYVHQLQNLYFALTGEELTVK